MKSDCVFCKIIDRKIPATIVAERDELIVIQDIAPKAPIHYLIIPKKHLTSIHNFEDADASIAAAIILTARDLAREKGGIPFKLVMNNGREAGQVVFHQHCHFLAGTLMSE